MLNVSIEDSITILLPIQIYLSKPYDFSKFQVDSRVNGGDMY